MAKPAKKKVNIKISKKVFSPAFLSALKDENRNLILYGGAGSGKSIFAGQKILYRILTEPKHKILVIRKVANTLKDSVFSQLVETIEQWGLSKLFHITKAPMEITCVNGGKVIFKGLDDPEKIKSISGVSSVWIEEASELTQDDFNQLQLRLRGKHLNRFKYVQYIICFNPISEHHWLKKMFFDNEQPNTSIYHTTYLDNPFLDNQYIQTLENLKKVDENYYNIYCLGQWGSLGRMIYDKYSVESTDEFEYSYFDQITYGIDFGFEDPSVVLKIGVKGDTIYVLDEIYKKHLTNTDLIDVMNKEVDKEYRIYADSAEPARIKDIQRHGFKIQAVKKGKDSIRHGIDFIKSHHLIIDPKCKNTIKELQGYVWKKDKNGKTIEEPVGLDHCLDSLRYAIEQLRLSRKPKKKGRVVTKSMLGF